MQYFLRPLNKSNHRLEWLEIVRYTAKWYTNMDLGCETELGPSVQCEQTSMYNKTQLLSHNALCFAMRMN